MTEHVTSHGAISPENAKAQQRSKVGLADRKLVTFSKAMLHLWWSFITVNGTLYKFHILVLVDHVKHRLTKNSKKKKQHRTQCQEI